MRTSAAILALSAGAVGAAADVSLDLSILLSYDGVNWSNMAFRLPGSVIQVGIFMSGAGGDVYGMGGATCRMNVTSAGLDDSLAFAPGTATGRVGPFNFGAATNAIYRDTPGSFRIDAAADPENSNDRAGLTFLQRDPATATPGTFSTANPALVFRTVYTVGSDGGVFDTRLSLDQLARGVAAYWSVSNSTRPTLTSNVTFGEAHIFLPAPGVLAAASLAVALGSFRRRAARG